MSGHSEKGPSSSSRWIHCTPSVKLCSDMPDKGSTFAAEGTDAHALCEYLLKRALGQSAEDPTENLSYYNQEMQECAEGYRDFVMGLVEEARATTEDVVTKVEQQIRYDRFVEGGFGTADFVLIADGVLHVVDFKYGLGVEVSAVGNSQMRIYALGALEEFDYLYDVDEVRMTIYQPRKNNLSSDTITKQALYEWAEEVLRPAALEADAGTGDFHAGDWCRFCKARYICRERANENLRLAAYDFTSPPLLEDEEIEAILESVDKLVSWANDVKEYALQEAVAGRTWTNFKLVEGRSIRKYTNEKTVAERALAAGYEPYTQKVLGVTELQKQMGKKKFEEILGELVIKPPGKPVLVRRDDKRPELNTAKRDFEE